MVFDCWSKSLFDLRFCPPGFGDELTDRDSVAGTPFDAGNENRSAVAGGKSFQKLFYTSHAQRRECIEDDATANGDQWGELPDDEAVSGDQECRPGKFQPGEYPIARSKSLGSVEHNLG